MIAFINFASFGSLILRCDCKDGTIATNVIPVSKYRMVIYSSFHEHSGHVVHGTNCPLVKSALAWAGKQEGGMVGEESSRGVDLYLMSNRRGASEGEVYRPVHTASHRGLWFSQGGATSSRRVTKTAGIKSNLIFFSWIHHGMWIGALWGRHCEEHLFISLCWLVCWLLFSVYNT